MLDHILFGNKDWFQGQWYKCNGHNSDGWVWLWQYDGKTKSMKTIYAYNAEGIASLPGQTLVKVGPPVNYQCENRQDVGTQNAFRMISKCPKYPQYNGYYVMSNDLIFIGGGK